MSLVIILFGLKFGYSTFVEEISIKLFKKTDVSKDLNIVQSYIDYFAEHNSFIYAIVAVTVAIIFGLLGAYLSKKISN
jgi:ABC-type Fe3+ transport system permease subunit